jgi:hypothetical protein
MKIPLVSSELLLADRWTDGRTDRHGEANSFSSESYERVQNCQFIFKLLTQADGSKQISPDKTQLLQRQSAVYSDMHVTIFQKGQLPPFAEGKQRICCYAYGQIDRKIQEDLFASVFR